MAPLLASLLTGIVGNVVAKRVNENLPPVQQNLPQPNNNTAVYIAGGALVLLVIVVIIAVVYKN
jgi:hypothetical protein